MKTKLIEVWSNQKATDIRVDNKIVVKNLTIRHIDKLISDLQAISKIRKAYKPQ